MDKIINFANVIIAGKEQLIDNLLRNRYDMDTLSCIVDVDLDMVDINFDVITSNDVMMKRAVGKFNVTTYIDYFNEDDADVEEYESFEFGAEISIELDSYNRCVISVTNRGTMAEAA